MNEDGLGDEAGCGRNGPSEPPAQEPEPGRLNLLAQHRAFLQARAVSDEAARARGYFSAERRRDLEAIGFSGAQAQLVPSLVIPILDVRGEIAFHQLRPDTPRERNGKRLKYETKRGARMVIDVPPSIRADLVDPAKPLFITEGVPKADAATSVGLCCIALLGVWNWRGRNDLGGTLALSCWESIPLNDRITFIVFDSDVMTKAPVAKALARLANFLRGRGAQVHFVYLPPSQSGAKQGLDDFLAAGHSVEELIDRATTELRGVTVREDASDYAPPYAVVDGCIVREKQTKDGLVDQPLCNFVARIVSEAVRDDGVERRLHYLIEGALRGGETLPPIEIPAERFPVMSWPAEWGTRAVV